MTTPNFHSMSNEELVAWVTAYNDDHFDLGELPGFDDDGPSEDDDEDGHWGCDNALDEMTPSAREEWEAAAEELASLR